VAEGRRQRSGGDAGAGEEPERAAALRDLRAFHAEVDERAAALAARHAGRLRCRRGCASCCLDGLTVFEVEAERIRAEHAELLRSGTPHAPGACAFLDGDGACRIHAARPYVCRTQGPPLRWFEEAAADGASPRVVERRDVCPLNRAGPSLEGLADDACWLLGPGEERLAAIQERFARGAQPRVDLRSLFRRSA
jgi:hypothetical protein